ncbi:MAG: magnesium transporter [Phycisphaerales bacterium]|nr:magnesium transporter [Phycisphaerales bacterium]MCI0676924.1 magnesium transporter [Phycisphaerales bacterium]
MPDQADPRPWEHLEHFAQSGDASGLQRYLSSLSSGEAARAVSRLDAQQQSRILTLLDPEQAAALIEECPQAEARELIEQLPPQEAAAILAEMPSDEQADLITALDPQDAEAILQEMGVDDAADARKLASYQSDEAGGLMVTEYLAFPETLPAGEVFEELRRNAEKYADYDVQYVYCTSPFGDLVGVLRLRDLLLTPQHKPICDLMIRKPVAASAHATIDELAELFERSGFFGVPVVDNGGKLVGVVKRRDVEAARAERAESDFLKSQGIVGGDELRTMPLRSRIRRRLTWLSGNIVLNMLAAAVIAIYQDTLAQVIALAVFLPIISDMSGNAGIQAIAVSLREMTLGLLKPTEFAWVFVKEVSLGAVNGIVLGVLVAIVAVIWQGNPYLGLVVGVALALNTVLAAIIGGTLPLLLTRMKMDPALASGPILTTITDMCGFFFVLSFATAVLPMLK